MARDEFWHIPGNVHPGVEVHRQVCLKHNVYVCIYIYIYIYIYLSIMYISIIHFIIM